MRLLRTVFTLFAIALIGARAAGAQSPQPAVPPVALSFGVYATGTGCSAITMSGGASVDSFDSSQGSYNETQRQSDGIVGVSGNINLAGGSTIYGQIYALNTAVGSCRNGIPGITVSGRSRATGGYVRMSAAPLFPAPASITPGTQSLAITRNTTLPPGKYGDLAVSGGATLTLSAGSYDINSLSLSGGSILRLAPTGQVIINVAGNRVSQPVNLSAGTLVSPSGIPLNFQLLYGGDKSLVLSGGAMAYGVVYAPNASVRLSGGGAWFGSLTVKTLDDSGGSPIHYDRSLRMPPTITLTATPSPNTNGWNNTDVVVSFVCSSTLGITSCPSPTTVTTQGGNQVVTGTARDNAGNTATASVTLSIDTTPPQVTATASPAANANGWNNVPVTVAFSATDALSGVSPASVTPPVTLSTDGANQSAAGQAADLAGNVGTVTRAGVNIDQTAPVVVITSPPDGATVFAASLPVAGTAGDATSGLASVTCNGLPVALGSSLNCDISLAPRTNAIVVEAVDRAGNTGAASIAVNYVPAPVLTSVSPPGAVQGQTVSVVLTGGSFVQGTTEASLGPAISVGGAAEGSFGPVTVTSDTTAVAQLAISTAAMEGPRTVAVQNGSQRASLAAGFTVALDPLKLPPDPGEAGKQTLAGVDSDGDGVRDDIQRYIALAYPSSPPIRSALRQFAMANQNFIFNSSGPPSLIIQITTVRNQAQDCLNYLINDGPQVLRIQRALRAQVLNTKARSLAYVYADAQLSGVFFPPPNRTASSCSF